MKHSLHSLIEVRLFWADLHHWPAGKSLHQDWLPAYCLWIGLRGEVQVRVADRDLKLGSGDVLWFPHGIARDIQTPVEAEWISLGLHASSPGATDLLQFWPATHAWHLAPDAVLLTLSTQLITVKTEDGAGALLREALTRSIFGVLWRYFDVGELNTMAGAHFPDWLAHALQVLRESPDISMQDLAHTVGISAAQLRRGFHEFLSTSPREYARRKRLEAARQAIENTDMPLHRIAELNGFSGAALFSRSIKTAFGLSPLELRRAVQQPPV